MPASIEEETEPVGVLFSRVELRHGYVPVNINLGSISSFPDAMEEKIQPIMGFSPL